jgi:hypothetical protein
MVILFLRPLFAVDGWPQNHEGQRNFHRTAIYAAHLERGDLVPVWADSVVLGYGGPFPAYYHRLFYYVSSICHLSGLSLKTSLLLALGLFAAVGVWGMQRVFLHLWPVPALGVLLASGAAIFNNYSYTLCVVRGALAEFAAMMLLPWGFLWCLWLVGNVSPRKLLATGVLFFPLLYLAHSVIFFYFAGPVLAGAVYALWRRPERRALLGTFAGIAGAFALVAGPTFYLQHLLGQGFAFYEGIAIYQPQNAFRPFFAYLWDSGYEWGVTWKTLSVELDTPILFAALFALILMGWYFSRKEAVTSPLDSGGARRRASEMVILGMLAYYVFWLTPAAHGVYAHVPGFALIQFPWRLLTYLTLLLPLLAWCGLARLARYKIPRNPEAIGGGAIVLLALVLSSPWTAPLQTERIPAERIQEPYTGYTAIKVGDAEYTPIIGDLDGPARLARLRNFSPRPWHRVWTGEAYEAERLNPLPFEPAAHLYRVTVATETTVAFALAYSPCHIVTVETEEGRMVPARAYRTDLDPRLQIDLPPGHYRVELRFPTLRNLLFR